MSLNVSDLVYVLDAKTHTVVPCKIVEKITSVSLEGENTHHMTVMPSGKSFKLENCKHPWFTTIDETKNFLKNAAENLISETIQKAQQTAKTSFGVKDEFENLQEEVSVQAAHQNFDVNQQVEVDLGDGRVAKVHLPDELLNAENTTS